MGLYSGEACHISSIIPVFWIKFSWDSDLFYMYIQIELTSWMTNSRMWNLRYHFCDFNERESSLRIRGGLSYHVCVEHFCTHAKQSPSMYTVQTPCLSSEHAHIICFTCWGNLWSIWDHFCTTTARCHFAFSHPGVCSLCAWRCLCP